MGEEAGQEACLKNNEEGSKEMEKVCIDHFGVKVKNTPSGEGNEILRGTVCDKKKLCVFENKKIETEERMQ